jgi:hypothetical protein
MSLNAYACLVIGAALSPAATPPQPGWRRGPLPVTIPGFRGPGTPSVADTAARIQYFAERIQPALYGDHIDGVDSTPRWHMFTANDQPDEHGSLIEGWELLRYGETDCLLVAHIQLGPDPLVSLFSLVQPQSASRSWIEASLPGPISLHAGRPRSLTHLLWEGDEIPEPDLNPRMLATLSSWTTIQRWQWFLASGVAADAFLPDPASPDLFDGTVYLSRDWRALVLRDGIAFVAMTPYDPDHTAFHSKARSYIRSIHVDALLLGILQLNALSQQADLTSQLGSVELDPNHITRLESDLLRLRARVWWEDIGQRGTQTSEVLRAFQRQHRLAALYRKIVEDLTDASRYTLARQAATADAARAIETARREARDEAHRAEEMRKQDFERTITLVSFILLPTSIVFSAMALWSNPSRILWVISVILSLILVTVTIAVSSILKKMSRQQ